MTSTATTVTLRRTEADERRAMRSIRFRWIMTMAVLSVCIITVVGILTAAAIFGSAGVAISSIAVAISGAGCYVQLNRIDRWYRVERQLRSLHLTVDQHGVTYGCTAGEIEHAMVSGTPGGVKGEAGSHRPLAAGRGRRFGGPLSPN